MTFCDDFDDMLQTNFFFGGGGGMRRDFTYVQMSLTVRTSNLFGSFGAISEGATVHITTDIKPTEERPF